MKGFEVMTMADVAAAVPCSVQALYNMRADQPGLMPGHAGTVGRAMIFDASAVRPALPKIREYMGNAAERASMTRKRALAEEAQRLDARKAELDAREEALREQHRQFRASEAQRQVQWDAAEAERKSHGVYTEHGRLT